MRSRWLRAAIALGAISLFGCGGSGDNKAAQVATPLIDPPSTASQVALIGGKVPGDHDLTDGGAPGTFLCGDTAGVASYCADHGVSPDKGGKVWEVCINDFSYYPPVVTPRQGDVVAWVNVE